MVSAWACVAFGPAAPVDADRGGSADVHAGLVLKDIGNLLDRMGWDEAGAV